MLRKCVGCGELKPRENLIKITKDYKDGNIVIEPDSKTFGRSAYLCIEAALKKSKLNKALRTSQSLQDKLAFCRGMLK